ncbi:MAG: hypothetical protein K1X89_29930 [Myxococcaceae bacterium]|nr:hypothetical protein [Myxococcaceae bacterium]
MAPTPPGSSAQLSDWLIEQLISPDGKVTANPAALAQARAVLAAEKDVYKLREAAEGVAALAEYIGGNLHETKVGEALIQLIVELKPRFEKVLGERSLDATARTVDAARAVGDRLGAAKAAQAPVPKGAPAAVEAKKFRGPMKG